jgi:hypothetical protein
MKKLVVLSLFAMLVVHLPEVAGKAVATSSNSNEQCPPPPAVVAMFLGFTPGQTEQFGILLAQFQANLRPVQEQIAAHQQQLNILVSQPNPDPAFVGSLVLQIHALQQQAAQVVESFHTACVALLTQEQKQKIEEVMLASQLQPVVGAFVTLYLVPPPPSLPCQKQ